MKVETVTFDCAQTLLEVNWKPAALAVECAQTLGLPVDESSHAAHYDRLLRTRWHEFRALNLTRDTVQTDAFWDRLTVDWCQDCGYADGAPEALLNLARERLFGSDSSVFRLYDDVVPCLEALATAGVAMGVVSNWDISLHRALESFGISRFFSVAVASMEEGVEKPDSRLFHIALEKIGSRPDVTLHVGDNPVDDFQGARAAGLRALIIDRTSPESSGASIGSLAELPGRIGL